LPAITATLETKLQMIIIQLPMEPGVLHTLTISSDRTKWKEGISKEFNEINAKGVWRKIQKSELPNGQNCIKSKWVFFKIKRNVVYRARLVDCGYSQVPGVDFQETFAPVINDVTFRILLVMMLTWNFKAKDIDIKTAFLHGDLKESIYMEIPKGWSFGRGDQ
jgi:Reverse transcriptase (RNA-dependent DNA polymerase)